MSKYNDLVKKLKEIFQIDRPELDFGVYRILNARSREINDYLENRLQAKVQETLSQQAEGDSATKIKELTATIRDEYGKRVFDEQGNLADETVKASELGQQLIQLQSAAPTAAEHENAVFTHLLTFFSRYYNSGDFISQRRYKGDTYAIPYAGEEVMLHWANKDQYYTKSGENFANYGFKLDDGRTVRFRLVTADTAKDNRKDNDKERRFVLIEPHTRILADDEGDEVEEELLPVVEENGELVLRFEYKAMPKGSNKQDVLAREAVNRVLEDPTVKARWLDLSKREPTENNPQRTLLEKCLTSYTTKNTADYFIHKDLGGFLRRELDFYVKNEVMHLDDVQNAEKFADIEKNLRLIQTLRAIALDLITFLAQLEDFQKKLWLKKKFVVATHYCITLDRVPESLYPEVAANSQQWDQWEKLGMLDGNKVDLFNQAKAGSVEYLKAHLFLMADTALFDDAFKYTLLAAVDNLDESLDGLLIHGDNFQALSLIDQKYAGMVDCIYIDPPYNTNATPILYKNEFKSSSWISFLENRLTASLLFIKQDSGYLSVAIDDNEISNLNSLIKVEYPQFDLHKAVVNHYPGSGTGRSNISRTHEYALFMVQKDRDILRGDATDSGVRERGFCRSGQGENNFRHGRQNSFYAVLVDTKKKEIRGVEPPPLLEVDYPKGATDDGLVRVYPLGQDNSERCWTLSYETAKKHIDNDTGILFCSTKLIIKRKYFDEESRGLLPSVWVDKKFSAVTNGTNLLTDIFGEGGLFSYPKSLYTVLTAIEAGTHQKDDSFFLDYFAGSGTTAHAVIALNRQDGGARKYALVEQGEYFDTVLKPRIQKVVYSSVWKDGKATAPETGISHAFKVLKLESYEDTLNNLQLQRSEAQQSLLDTLPQSAQEDYLLRYLLDIESRGSLLSVEQFNQPFDCKLKVTVDSAGAYEECSIDLVETFNYLIGLRVKHIDMQRDKGFVSITGWLPTGEKTLVLWRDLEQVDYETLNRLCEKLAINPADSEFEIVYINGDHNIPAVLTSLETEGGITRTLKIRQIEPEFLNRMFAVEDV